MSTELSQILSRLGHVEKSNRIMKKVFAFCGGLICAFLVMAMSKAPNQVFDDIRVQSITLIDSEGRVRMAFSAHSDTALKLYRGDGSVALGLIAPDNGDTSFELLSLPEFKNGKTILRSIRLHFSEGFPQIEALSPFDGQVSKLFVDHAGAAMSLEANMGVGKVEMGYGRDNVQGTQGMVFNMSYADVGTSMTAGPKEGSFNSQAGQSSVQFKLIREKIPSILLIDPTKKTVLEIPEKR